MDDELLSIGITDVSLTDISEPEIESMDGGAESEGESETETTEGAESEGETTEGAESEGETEGEEEYFYSFEDAETTEGPYHI